MMNCFRYLIPVLASVIGLCSCACSNDSEEWKPGNNANGNNQQEEEIDWSARAKETYDAIVSAYQIRQGLAAGYFTEVQGGKAVSFIWPYDGMCSAFAALNRLGIDVDYITRIERLQGYWRNSANGVNTGGYGSQTDGVNGGGDRFYDDNSIIGIELVEAYRQTGDSKYLDRCASIVEFLKTGIDDTMGTALWWCESQHNKPGRDDSNKPACANGYATWFLLQYYEVCPEAEKSSVLKMASGLYDWLYENLRDSSDNVYWNSVQADKSINKTKWTYNSGAMIAAGLRLYKATGDKSYLNQAKATADGAYNYFVRSRNGLPLSYPTNDPWFTIQLIKSYMELESEHQKCKAYISTFISNLKNAWTHGRDDYGLFYEDWTGVTVNKDRDHTLLMQAAALESLATVALYTKERK